MMRLKDKKRRRLIGRVIDITFAFFGVGVIVIFFLRLPVFVIETVSVSGNIVLESSMLAHVVSSATHTPYFGIIPAAHRLFYPKKKVIDALASSSERVASVELSLRNKVATVVVTERTPYALWCEFDEPQHCVLIDKTGFAFAPAPIVDGSGFIRFFLSSTTHVREHVLGTHYGRATVSFDEVLYVVYELTAMGLLPKEVYVNEIDSLRVITKQDVEILIGRPSGYSSALARLALLITDPTIPVGQLLKQQRLQTIDVRFEGKALFRESISTTTPHTF